MADRSYYWVVDDSLATLAATAGMSGYITDTPMGSGVYADDWNDFYFGIADYLFENDLNVDLDSLANDRFSVYWSQAAGSWFYNN